MIGILKVPSFCTFPTMHRQRSLQFRRLPQRCYRAISERRDECTKAPVDHRPRCLCVSFVVAPLLICEPSASSILLATRSLLVTRVWARLYCTVNADRIRGDDHCQRCRGAVWTRVPGVNSGTGIRANLNRSESVLPFAIRVQAASSAQTMCYVALTARHILSTASDIAAMVHSRSSLFASWQSANPIQGHPCRSPGG